MAKDKFGHGIEQKPNWNDLGRDHQLDVVVELGNGILGTIPSNISARLDNTDQPYEMAKSLLEHTNGDIDKAGKLVRKTNKNYTKKSYTENHGTGDYWIYWTNSFPDIYNK